MDTTDFEDVLREACTEVGEDGDNVSAQEWVAWRRFANKRLDAAWRYHLWPDLVRCERRYYRLAWSATGNYAQAPGGPGPNDNSANEVWWALTGQYFVALQANGPLAAGGVQQPTDANGNVNLGYWAVTNQYGIQPDPSGTAYWWPENPPWPNAMINQPPFDPSVTYVQGQRVQYAGNVYQLFAASATGNLPTDNTVWGLLPVFDAYVGYEQAGWTPFTVVEGVFSANPRTTTRGNLLNYFLSERGIQVRTPVAAPWVQYRIRCPKLTGQLFRADVAYVAGAGMYYSSANVPGNFYTALTVTNAGDTPESAPGKWSVVQIPRIFHRYLVLGMAADWLAGPDPKDPMKVQLDAALQGLAVAELDEVKSLYVGQMGQRVKTIVRTR